MPVNTTQTVAFSSMKEARCNAVAAMFASTDRSYVGGVERGERNITFLTLCRLCDALKCDVAALTAGMSA